jgi:hypothetical protein
VHEIHLSGGEVTFLKALGVSGAPMFGRLLLSRLGEVDENELIETIESLVDMDYVVSSKVNVQSIADVERSMFRVNSTYADELRDALHPHRRRREQRGRRERRR